MPRNLGERLNYPPKPEAVSHNEEQGGKEIAPPKQPKKEISKEEFELYKKKLQKIVDANKAALEAFSGDVSLKYEVSDKYAFDFDKGVVYLDATTMHEKGESEVQAYWSILHELSHFKDFVLDRQGIMDHFKHIQRKAKQIAPVIREKCEEAFKEKPELLEKLEAKHPSGSKTLDPMNWYEQVGYKMYHKFYNSLDDIHVNARVAWEQKRFRPEEKGGEEINVLYREKLFPANDVAEYPRHMQLHDKLLREFMVPEQNVIVNEIVSDKIHEPVAFMGVKRTPTEWVREICVPGVTKDKKSGKRKLKDTKSSTRNAVLRKVLEPAFDDLLRRDLEEWMPKEPQEMPFQQAYEAHEGMTPDHAPEEFFEGLSDKVIEALKKIVEEKKKQEEEEKKSRGMTPEQRALENKDRADREWCKKHEVSYEQFKQFEQLEREITPHLDELSNLWTKILHGLRIEQGRKMEGFFKTGELNLPKVVEEWPDIAEGKFEHVRVMERQVPKEQIVRMPEEIRIRLLGDNSGSMGGERIEMVRRVAALILSSVSEFNTRMAWQAEEGNVVKASSQVISYGSSAVESKPLDSNGEKEKADVVKAVTAFNAGEGSTMDAAALLDVWETIKTPEEQERIKSGKVVDILFEITDGGTQTLHDSVALLKKIREAGVVTKAFLVGEPYPGSYDQEIFDSEWNSGGQQDGAKVGNDLASVVPSITKMLEEVIGGRFG